MSKDYERYCDPALLEEAKDSLNLEDFEEPALGEVSAQELLLAALEEIHSEKK